jgi:hypothetical protein
MLVNPNPTVESAPSCICGGVPRWQRTQRLEQCPHCNELKVKFVLLCPGCGEVYGQSLVPLAPRVTA